MTSTIQRLPAIQAKTGYSRSTIYQRIKEGLFPKPIKLGKRAAGWVLDEVEAVNRARIAGATAAEIQTLVSKLHAKRKEDQL